MNYVFVWLSLIYGLVFLHIQITTQTYIMEYPLLLLVSATLKKKKKSVSMFQQRSPLLLKSLLFIFCPRDLLSRSQ